PIFPGESRTYDMSPRQDGSMFYHCHVQPQTHVLMGLNGLFVVEPNRPDNWVQTLNVGSGQVRHPSVAVKESHDREYDLNYIGIDYDMHNILKTSNDPRVVSRRLHREYNVTQRKPEAFLLNGRSFPYTIRESLLIVKPDENIKVRVLNSGADPIYLHTHGHKVIETHYDGIERPEANRITRDVVHVGPAQRVDLNLRTVDDGLHSYGPGVWFMHDHREEGVTTNGIGPGGNVSMIVYEEFLGENGIPKTKGDLTTFFTEEYYRGEIPVFSEMDPKGLLSEPIPAASTSAGIALTALLVAFLGVFFGSLIWLIRTGSGGAARADG
ncbi:MAG: multicopper oxidase domain-containing protein, partial [Verrucomicrobiota bacterium]